MVKVTFSPKEAIAEAANNILKAFLIANGSDEQTASMFGAVISGAIKGIGIESRKSIRSGLDAAIKRAWIEILSNEKYENLTEDCKMALKHDILSANTAIEDLNTENPVYVLRERIRPILREHTNMGENDIYNYAGNMSQQLLLAVNNELDFDGILTLLEGIEQLKNGLVTSTEKLENIDAKLGKSFQEFIEKFEKIETNLLSAKPKEDIYKQLKDIFDHERKNHASIRMMNPDPLLFPKGLPEILSDGRYAVEDKESPRAIRIRDIILDSWKRDDSRHILLIGKGGIGKTVAMLMLPEEDWLKKLEIPVIYVPLQRLGKYKGDLNRYMQVKIGSVNFDSCIKLANRVSREHPLLLLLLDGFNEIPDKHKKIAAEYIRDWMEKPGIQIITTSRLGFSLEKHFSKYRLQPLPYDTVRSFLLSAGIKEEALPMESDRISKVINVPLMLTMFAQIETVKDVANLSSASSILEWKEPDNAAHIIWDYLQTELYRCIEREDTSHSVMQYAIAILVVAPYICCQMSHRMSFYIKWDTFIQLIRDALVFYSTHQNLLNNQILNVRRKFSRKHVENDLFQESKAEEYASILLDNIALFQEQEIREKDYENEDIIDYSCSLMHQDFRDALAAFFICSCIPKTSNRKEKKALLDYADYDVKNYMAEYLSSNELISIWDKHRKENAEDGHITYILLDLICCQRNYDYRKLNFSGIDLTITNLHNLLSRRLDICPLSSDKENFKQTKVSVNCFLPNGHEYGVVSVAYSPDGRHLASGAGDSTVRVWDLVSGESHVLEGHMDNVDCVAYSPDGRHIASIANDDTVRIWDLESKKSRVLQVHTGLVNSVAYSPDGKHLASGAGDCAVQVWNLESGESRMFQGHADWVRSVSFSPDGKYLASGAEDSTVRIWDLVSGESRVLEGHKGMVLSVAYSPDGKHLASASSDSTVRIWDLENEKNCVLQSHANIVFSVAYSPDGRHLASGEEDSTVRIWDLKSGESRTLKGHVGWVNSVAYSPDGRHLANCTGDSAVRIWNLENWEIRVLQGHADGGKSVAYSPDGRHIAVGSGDSTVRIWNLNSREIRILEGHKGMVLSVAYSPDGRHLASGAEDSAVRVWNLESGEIRMLEGHEGMVNSVAYSPDGKHLASVAKYSTVRIWDLESGKSHVLQSHENLVFCVAYSPDGRHLAGAEDDRTLQIWDLESGKSRVLEGHTFWVNSIAYSPDGRHLAIGADDSAVRIWDLESGKSHVLKGPTRAVRSIAYSPDGRHLAIGESSHMGMSLENGDSRMLERFPDCVNNAEYSTRSGAEDSTVRIWDLESGESHVLEGHTVWVNSIAYSPDGRHLASGAEDSTVRIWDLEEHQEVAKIAIIPHMNLCGANFELAVIDEKDKEILIATGAKILTNGGS